MWRPDKEDYAGDGGGEAREYVSVIADYLPDGAVRPVSIRFDCGPAYAITGIMSEIHMSSTKKNGAETRYCVRVGDREHYLYFEDVSRSRKSRWFVYDSGIEADYAKRRV